ncbi:MAG: Gfo/Idh/MocA family oxidoreductase [Pseudomonadota bacterium]
MPRGDGDDIKMSQIAVGVVGAGVFGRYHAQKLAAAPRARISAVFDIDAGRARELATAVGVDVADTLDALLERSDAVVVAAPASVHVRIAEQVLAAGKHCLVEKPLSLNVDDADRLIEAAMTSDLVLQVGHQERYVADAFNLSKLGAASDRLSFRRCGPRSGRCEDVSVVWDLMIHDFDLARRFGFGEPVSVVAHGDDDATRAVMTFDDGRAIEFFASRCAESVERTVSFHKGGAARVFDFCGPAFLNAPEGDFAVARDAELVADPLGYGVRDFVNAVIYKRAPIVSGRDGRGAVAWAAAVDEALVRNAAALEPADLLREAVA